jgi:CubicO group peptidase (beta-lactamase class C family)
MTPNPPKRRLPTFALLLGMAMLSIPILIPIGAGLSAQTTGAEAAAAASFEARWAEAAALFHARAQETGVVGASLWFMHAGEVVGRELHGYADLTGGRPVDDQTIFHWASNTKTLTGIAILQLRDRGLLPLDDPAVRFLPELWEVHNPFGPMDGITVRHLLSHTAGFRSSTWPWGGDQPWHPYEPTRWDQLAAMMPYTEILFEPGSRFGYSNPAIVFLGQIIERISGEDWEVYVDKNILRPLGMHRSYFDITPPHLRADRAHSYRIRGGEPVAWDPDFNTGITVSNGGLNAPIPDLLRYLAFLSGALAADDPGATVLARGSLEEMWHPVVPVGEGAAWGESHEAMGLTFFVTETPAGAGGGRLVGHTGSQRDFLSFIYVDPDTGAAAIGVFNTDEAAGPDRTLFARALMNEIRAKLAADVFPVFR